MRRVLPMTIFVAAIAAAAAAQYAAGRMELAEFQKLHAGGKILVVDVRDPGSFNNGHIPGAINVPLGTEEQHVARLKAEKRPIVTYCA